MAVLPHPPRVHPPLFVSSTSPEVPGNSLDSEGGLWSVRVMRAVSSLPKWREGAALITLGKLWFLLKLWTNILDGVLVRVSDP